MNDYSTDSFDMYMLDVKEHALLTPHEEITLIAAAQRGDSTARERVILCNTLLVVSIAKRYLNSGVALPDLVQEGNIGLIRAVGKFDTTKRYKFSTYATWWIRQAISRYVGEYQRLIRVPSYIATQLYRLRQAQRALEARDMPVTTTSLAQYLHTEEGDVAALQRLSLSIISIDEPLDGTSGDDLFLADTLTGDDRLEDEAARRHLQEQVRAVLNSTHILNAREREVIELRFGIGHGEGMTLDAVGKLIGVSRERVRQNEATALVKLAPHLRHLREVREEKEEVSA